MVTYDIFSKYYDIYEMSKDATFLVVIHKAKDHKPTNDKPNISGMYFYINLKKIIRQIVERLQFMKTIEGTYLNIQD